MDGKVGGVTENLTQNECTIQNVYLHQHIELEFYTLYIEVKYIEDTKTLRNKMAFPKWKYNKRSLGLYKNKQDAKDEESKYEINSVHSCWVPENPTSFDNKKLSYDNEYVYFEIPDDRDSAITRNKIFGIMGLTFVCVPPIIFICGMLGIFIFPSCCCRKKKQEDIDIEMKSKEEIKDGEIIKN